MTFGTLTLIVAAGLDLSGPTRRTPCRTYANAGAPVRFVRGPGNPTQAALAPISGQLLPKRAPALSVGGMLTFVLAGVLAGFAVLPTGVPVAVPVVVVALGVTTGGAVVAGQRAPEGDFLRMTALNGVGGSSSC